MVSKKDIVSIRKHKRYDLRLFKKYAPFYDYVEFIIGPLRDKVADKISRKNLKILDVACGTGSQTIALAKKGHTVVGIDISPDLLSYAKKKIKPGYNIKFICGDATKIPYNDSTFDVSSISFGFHDMPEEIGVMIMKEMVRTTKKNGKIIITDYHKPKNRFVALLSNKICKTWESKYYDGFMQIGVEHYLNKANQKLEFKELYLLGIIQIVGCVNRK